jgi:hypothetical protein
MIALGYEDRCRTVWGNKRTNWRLVSTQRKSLIAVSSFLKRRFVARLLSATPLSQ